MKPVVKLLKHQIEFIFDRTRYLALVAGYRGGKTFAAAHKIIWLATNNLGYDGIICSPTYSMLKRVLIPVLEDALKTVGIPYTYKIADGQFILHLHKDTKIHCLSAENYKRIAGISAAWGVLDEYDLIEMELAELSFRMITSRLTHGNIIQLCVVTTPEGHKFIHDYFCEKALLEDGTPDPNKKLIRASTRDNPFITPDYVEMLTAQYPANLLEAYLDGHFVNLTNGNVYNFIREQNFTDKDISSFHNNYPLSLGVDFNVNVMGTVVSIIVDNKVYCIDEIHGDANTESLIRTIKTKFPNRQIHIYPDASGAANKSSASTSDIAQLRNAGFKVFVKATNPKIKDRVAAVNAKLRNGNNINTLFVNKKCTKLIKGLEQQGYDKNGQPDKSGGLDHLLDSLGYIISYEFPIKTNNSNVIRKTR